MVLALGSLLLNPNEMKHIEQILPEYAAEELERIVREEGDATASAALSRLLHNVTGCAIPPTATTPESEVEELVPLCLSILRRHWTTPLTALGDGTTPMSLADLLRRLIGDRVQGNEALGIPPANANIPTAVSALCDRHIADGLTLTLTDGTDGSTPTTISLPDGLSLAQLLCGVSPDGTDIASQVTEIVDSNIGWTATKPFGTFDNTKRLSLNCVAIDNPNDSTFFLTTPITELRLDHLKDFFFVTGNYYYRNGMMKGGMVERLETPMLERICKRDGTAGAQTTFLYDCPNIKEWIAPKLSYIGCEWVVDKCPNLEKVVFGTLTRQWGNAYGSYAKNFTESTSKLIHFEIGAGTAISLNMIWWLPSAETLANPEFLSNFKTYIAQRLIDKVSGLTLTLSQAVRDAIQQDPEIVSIITSKGWTISPAPSV